MKPIKRFAGNAKRRSDGGRRLQDFRTRNSEHLRYTIAINAVEFIFLVRVHVTHYGTSVRSLCLVTL